MIDRIGISAKYDGAVVVSENFPLDMLTYGTREYDFFQISTFFNQIIHSILMCDPHHILLDDRACIEFGGDIVACGADKFHASLVSLMIRLRPDKCREGKSGVC